MALLFALKTDDVQAFGRYGAAISLGPPQVGLYLGRRASPCSGLGRKLGPILRDWSAFVNFHFIQFIDDRLQFIICSGHSGHRRHRWLYSECVFPVQHFIHIDGFL